MPPKKIKCVLNKLFNEQKFFRRFILLWAVTLITMFVLFLMNVELLLGIGAAGATVATGVIGILATVIGFYMQHRKQDDERDGGGE